MPNESRYLLGPPLHEDEAVELSPHELICITFWSKDDHDELIYQVIGTVEHLSKAPIWDVDPNTSTSVKRVSVG